MSGQGGFGRQSSYYDTKQRQSPALIRARRPYLFKNVMVGVVTASLAAGVCTFISPPVLHAAIANTFTGAPAWSTTRSQHAQETHEKKLDSRAPEITC
ncbi:cytochrome c oxidase assembly factor 3 [Microdochium nivale]|nr:cytochrome c oxidase assembly factor 3 [Microdochium nivale]